MSKATRPCYFDNSIECPVRKVADVHRASLLEKACPICPKRLKMVEKS
jgi:hypothetical protein